MTIDLSVSPKDTSKPSQADFVPQHSTPFSRCFQNYYHGHNYLQPTPRYITGVDAVINHWQIRDLIQVADNGDVFYTRKNGLWRLRETKNGVVSSEYLKPDYGPKCFGIGPDGVAVTGGLMTSTYKIFYSEAEPLAWSNKPQKGLFTFHNPHINATKTVSLGEMINNSVSVYGHGARYQAFTCNNDSRMYCVDIDNGRLQVHNAIVCEADTSLNNMARSPTDHKFVAVTGDTSSVFLVDPTGGKIATIRTNHDRGFGVSFHPNGLVFATAFEDGSCCLYDIREMADPLKEFKSTRTGHQAGAFRCCKFSNTPFNDILVVAEHVGRVHLIDMRNISDTNHQVVVFPAALDQFAAYKWNNSSHKDFESGQHHKFSIFDDPSPFTAPLVYDYEYLTTVNPKLFKYYNYQPDTFFAANATPETWDADPFTFEDSFHNTSFSPNFHSRPAAFASETYQRNDVHVYGEMELAGVAWHDNHLIIGSENGGLMKWDINYIARRSFGSFSCL